MLTGMHIAIIGGDARQLEIIRKLTELDAKLSLIGFDQLSDGFIGAKKQTFEDVEFQTVDAIILPSSGANQTGEVETIFSNETIHLKPDIVKETPEHCIIYTGISTDYLTQCAKDANRKLVKLFERDDVAIYNSIPTVEGTIMMAIQHTDITIHKANVMVLGLGRVGMSAARTFSALGARVKVGANQSDQLARITEMGLEPFHTKNLEEAVGDVDICINTVPELILTAKVIAKMPTNALILDLASKPGGTDFRYAEKRGVKALLAPGLPGIVAPKTAGKILANVLSQLLSEEYEKREEDS
ncbi:dipicolinic acid synthetase subunit A [Desertibacillus haloalkaliphilus]|uniref:dipicolinic acid synthetase subunit A n=1 Tax=Desertibacillus haloalkaliphilus TaxID=1328930 RepID=UPI001C275A02|nr:dipicolinic acid synthetase subunit A [Desertibacillus haloalkaliphilus]MBU8906961.1 dipicolinic acid synthetase subunit A [Desertibacillus haloalkaliphilus]